MPFSSPDCRVSARYQSSLLSRLGKKVSDTAYITKVHVKPESDTFFPNLDKREDWYLAETLQSGEENGIGYEMLLYKRR